MKIALHTAAALASMTVLAMTATGCGKMTMSVPDGVTQDRTAGSGSGAGNIIVARVNGASITMDALVRMMNRIGPPRNQGNELPRVKKDALDQLILQELACQQATALGIKIEQKFVDSAVSNFKENVGGEQELASYLARQNMTETELRTEFERAFGFQRVYEAEVVQKAIVPEEVLGQEYEREKHRYVVPEKLAATDVFLIKPADPESGRNKAREIRKKILSNETRDPWKLVLDGTFLVRSIILNRERQPDLYRAAKNMKPGEISDVISADDGFHILVLTSASPERQIPFDEARDVLEGKHRVAAQNNRLAAWKKELMQAATIEILDQGIQAQQNTDGTGAGGK